MTNINKKLSETSEKSRDIKEKLEQYQKEGRKIIQDEHGLTFYEGMTPREKIEWIEAKIKRLQEAAMSPFLGQRGVIRYAKDDFYEGLDKDYYKNKYGPYGYKKYIKRDLKKIINKEMQEAESRHEKRKREYEAEIKEYQEDIKYYETKI